MNPKNALSLLKVLTKRDSVPLLVITALALATRLYRLGAQCFWYDEAQTLFVAQFPLGEIIQRTYRPPLYHILLHLWASWVPASEFWLRMPSAVAGTLVPPLIYLCAAKAYNRRTAWLAGMLSILSPTLIAYSQELRMYSLMALECGLLLYLYITTLQSQRLSLTQWAGLTLSSVASLYTHYFAIPFLLCLDALALGELGWQKRWRIARAWLTSQAIAALAFVPWIAFILQGRGGTEDYLEAQVLPVLPEIPGVGAFLQRVWLFYTTGPVTSEMPAVRLLALATAIVFMLGLGERLFQAAWHKFRRHDLPVSLQWDVRFFAFMLLPAAGAMFMYHLRPGVVHPRHLMMLAVPLALFLGHLSQPLWKSFQTWRAKNLYDLLRSLLAGAVVILFSTLSVLSYVQALREPALQRADVRLLAQEVQARTIMHTAVLLPYQDYAFQYYYQNHQAPLYYIETRVGDKDLLPWLLPRLYGINRVILLEWIHMHADPRDLLPWFLQHNGRLVERFWTAERWVSVYDLHPSLSIPPFEPTELRVGPLTLTGVSLPSSTPADQAIAIGLEWRLATPDPRDLKVSVRLVDPTGQVIAADDRVLLAENAAIPTSRWKVGQTARNYYFLEAPIGTAPLAYDVQITVYSPEGTLEILDARGNIQGTVATIGRIHLTPRQDFPAHLPEGLPSRPINQEVAPGLEILGYTPSQNSIRPGERLFITLYWRATSTEMPPYEPILEVIDANNQLVAHQKGAPCQGLYPTNQWALGEIVADRRFLRLAPESSAGPAHIMLKVADKRISLGTLSIEPSDRSFSLPPLPYIVDASIGGMARLAGFAIASTTLKAGEPFDLTLYWESLAQETPEKDYTVFVHLVDPNGQIIAQHDGPPAQGTWPTTTWIQGQAITDTHHLTFRKADYRGQAILLVGLYDPQTLQRLTTDQGQDHVTLPITLYVE